jgi:hypothetical protein
LCGLATWHGLCSRISSDSDLDEDTSKENDQDAEEEEDAYVKMMRMRKAICQI